MSGRAFWSRRYAAGLCFIQKKKTAKRFDTIGWRCYVWSQPVEKTGGEPQKINVGRLFFGRYNSERFVGWSRKEGATKTKTEGRSYMKNITNPLLTLAVGLGLFALTASQVQATGTGEFSVKLTRYQEGDSSTDGNNLKYTIDKAKVTTKDLLAFIQDNSSPAVNIPDGAYLEVDENGHFTVLDKNGDEVVVENLHHLIYLGYGDGVWSGKFNTETHQQKDKGNFLVYFGIESLDEKDHIDTQGLGKESYSRGDTTKSSWKESTSITVPVAGDGEFGLEFTTIEGTVTIKGNEKLTAPGS